MPRPIRTLAFVGAVALITYGLWARGGISDARWLATLGGAWLLLLIATRLRLPSSTPRVNRTIIRTALLLATTFVVVSAQLVRIQVVQSEATASRAERAPNGEVVANPRIGNAALTVQRGQVFDRDGELLAATVPAGDIWRRVYPIPEAAYVVGYFSPLLYGNAGLEATYNEELTGQAGNNPFLRWQNNLLHRPQTGLDLQLTLDVELQQTAHSLLAGRPGAVVVLDIETGEILTLASNPHFDSNLLFTGSPDESGAATDYWQQLINDPSSPLLLRATQGLFTPGSTFKTIAAAAAIDAGFSSPDRIYEDDGQINVDGRIIVEQNRPDASIDEWTLAEGLAWSLNVVFAQVGLQLGPTTLLEYGERFGFGERIPFDLPVAVSQIANSPEFLQSRPALAETAFGQGELLVTPLHLAMVAATLANGGVMMEPYLVDELTTQDGDIMRRTSPDEWREPVDSETANQVRDMMINVVENGSAQSALVPGYTVGGKTGTAETGTGEPHAWFIGFIGDPDPRYAVAVVLEGGGAGLAGAVTIARDMLATTMAVGPE